MTEDARAQPLLHAEGARIAVDDVVAVEAFSLLTRGDRLVLAGDTGPIFALFSGLPLGLGSALAQIATSGQLEPLAGFARLVSGTLAVRGLDLLHPRAVIVGVAPLDPPLPPELTIEEIVLESAQLGVARRTVRPSRSDLRGHVRRALDRVGLARSLSRRVPTLAQHERRALIIAQALVPQPEVLVVEAPLAGLDGQAAASVLGALTAASEGLAMLVSVTRLDPAAPEGPLVRSATDLAVFARGELALFGTPEEIVRGARVFRITVRSNAEALRVALEERGCTLSGGPMRFAVTLPQPIEPTEILRAAAAARAGVVEMVPLM